METNRIEDVARDGIHTVSQITRAAAQSGGEVAVDLATAVRTALDGIIEVAGGVVRTFVRVSAGVAIEVVDSLRTTVEALVSERRSREHLAEGGVRMGNGGEEHRMSA